MLIVRLLNCWILSFASYRMRSQFAVIDFLHLMQPFVRCLCLHHIGEKRYTLCPICLFSVRSNIILGLYNVFFI